MRTAAVRAERAAEVREAARDWERAGLHDAGQAEAVRRLYHDDRVRAGPAIRVLLFVFTTVAILATLWLVVAAHEPDDSSGWSLLCFLFGAALVALTEVQTGRLKRSQGGTEAATGFAAPWFLVTGIVLACTRDPNLTLVFACGTVVFGLTAWRWGLGIHAGLAACSFFLLLGRGPVPRLLWIAAASMLVLLCLGASRAARLAPSVRHAALWVSAVSLAALYAAVQIAALDYGLLDWIFDAGVPHAVHTGRERAVAIAATALLPLLVIALGVLARSRFLLGAGVVLAAASLVTLRHYVHVAPLWVVLVGSGCALIALTFAIRRYLDAGEGKERRGFTAEPLLEAGARGSGLEMAASLAMAHAASASPAPGEPAPQLEGGGGRSGGAGASGEW